MVKDAIHEAMGHAGNAQLLAVVFGAFRSAWKWACIGSSVLVLGTLYLTLPPLIIGVLAEATLFVPLRSSLDIDESFRFPLTQCWALGVVALKLWLR